MTTYLVTYLYKFVEQIYIHLRFLNDLMTNDFMTI